MVAAVVLAAPPVAVAVLAWPGDDDRRAAAIPDGVAFRLPVEDVHTAVVELDGRAWEVTLRPDASGVCFEVVTADSGSGTCGLQHELDVTAASVTISNGITDVVRLVDPAVASAEVVYDDGTLGSAAVVDLDGRPERVLVASGRTDDPERGTPHLRLLDGDGVVIEERELGGPPGF